MDIFDQTIVSAALARELKAAGWTEATEKMYYDCPVRGEEGILLARRDAVDFSSYVPGVEVYNAPARGSVVAWLRKKYDIEIDIVLEKDGYTWTVTRGRATTRPTKYTSSYVAAIEDALMFAVGLATNRE